STRAARAAGIGAAPVGGREGHSRAAARRAGGAGGAPPSGRSPPLGTRGFGPRRPMQYGRLGQQEYLQRANRDVFVVVQVETAELLADLDALLALEGLDSLVLGPQGLSGSMGRLGDTTHPEVVEAMT